MRIAVSVGELVDPPVTTALLRQIASSNLAAGQPSERQLPGSALGIGMSMYGALLTGRFRSPNPQFRFLAGRVFGGSATGTGWRILGGPGEGGPGGLKAVVRCSAVRRLGACGLETMSIGVQKGL